MMKHTGSKVTHMGSMTKGTGPHAGPSSKASIPNVQGMIKSNSAHVGVEGGIPKPFASQIKSTVGLK